MSSILDIMLKDFKRKDEVKNKQSPLELRVQKDASQRPPPHSKDYTVRPATYLRADDVEDGEAFGGESNEKEVEGSEDEKDSWMTSDIEEEEDVDMDPVHPTTGPMGKSAVAFALYKKQQQQLHDKKKAFPKCTMGAKNGTKTTTTTAVDAEVESVGENDHETQADFDNEDHVADADEEKGHPHEMEEEEEQADEMEEEKDADEDNSVLLQMRPRAKFSHVKMTFISLHPNRAKDYDLARYLWTMI